MITQKLRNKIRERDKGRCQECGLKVGKEIGLEGHIHHIVPRSDGGEDRLDNLITLCFFCHATKILKHWQLFEKKGKKLGSQYLKWALWEIGLNLTYAGFRINARNFPKYKIAAIVEATISALQELQPFIDDIQTDGGYPELTEVEELLKSIKIAHRSHDTQRTLDSIILKSQSGSN